ncbi:hypothetical protein GGD62_008061 [Bradyrhizobium sp. ERR14]|nr:hypothetical protein [Bradyrhizobium sp. ERR14]
MAHGREDDVGGIGISCVALEVAAQLALDDTEDAALLAGDKDATGILCVVAAVSLVDIGPLDRTAGERFGAVKARSIA